MNIIFVCTANICRSVMAEGILKRLATDFPMKQTVSIFSAGVDALEGIPPDRTTIEVCSEHGIPVSTYRAKQLTREMLENMDIILCMEKNHQLRIVGAFPVFFEKTFLLKEYLCPHPIDDVSIADPIGKSKKQYHACFDAIEHEVRRIAELILFKSD